MTLAERERMNLLSMLIQSEREQPEIPRIRQGNQRAHESEGIAARRGRTRNTGQHCAIRRRAQDQRQPRRQRSPASPTPSNRFRCDSR